MDGDTTIQLRRKDDREQVEFKRRAAYYAMMVIAGIVMKALLSDPDIGKAWAEILNTVIWTCGLIIIGAMGVDGITAYANMRANK